MDNIDHMRNAQMHDRLTADDALIMEALGYYHGMPISEARDFRIMKRATTVAEQCTKRMRCVFQHDLAHLSMVRTGGTMSEELIHGRFARIRDTLGDEWLALRDRRLG